MPIRRAVIYGGLVVTLALTMPGCTSETSLPASRASAGTVPASTGSASAAMSSAAPLSGWWRLSRIQQPGKRTLRIPRNLDLGLTFGPDGALAYGNSSARYRITSDGFAVQGQVTTNLSGYATDDPVILAAVDAGMEIMRTGGSFATTVTGDQLSMRIEDDELIFRHDKAVRLLTSDWEEGDGSMEAAIGGRLGADAKGCVTLGGAVLAAPKGSTLNADGQSVTMPVLGTVRLGQSVSTGGGVLEVEPGVRFPDRYRGCGTTKIAVINPSPDPTVIPPMQPSLSRG